MLKIETKRNLINWPQNTPLDKYTILDITGARGIRRTARDTDDLTHYIQVDADNVDVHTLGANHILLRLLDPQSADVATKTVELDVVKPSQADPQARELPQEPSASTARNNALGLHRPAKAPRKAKDPKKRTKLLTFLLLIVMILFALFGLRSCHNQHEQAQQNAQQSSQIAKDSSSISHLNTQNAQLKQQLADLKSAVKQYQQDQDKQELQDQLNNLKNQNAQAEQNASGSNLQSYHALDHAIDAINQNPDQASKIIDSIDSSSPTAWWDQVKNVISQYM